MALEPISLDFAGIISCCDRGFVPVGASPVAAILAHNAHPTPNTLHAIVTADTRDPDRCREMLDYLTKLPISAWHLPDGDIAAERRRDSVLEMMRRSIAWSETCA